MFLFHVSQDSKFVLLLFYRKNFEQRPTTDTLNTGAAIGKGGSLSGYKYPEGYLWGPVPSIPGYRDAGASPQPTPIPGWNDAGARVAGLSGAKQLADIKIPEISTRLTTNINASFTVTLNKAVLAREIKALLFEDLVKFGNNATTVTNTVVV